MTRLELIKETLKGFSETYDDLTPLLNVFYLAGGRISAYKRLKFLANLLSYGDRPYLTYYWTRQYFGDYSSSLSRDLNILIENDLIKWDVKESRPGDNFLSSGQFYNEFILTKNGIEISKQNVLDECGDDPDYLHQITGMVLACNMMPCSILMYQAIQSATRTQDECIPFSASILQYKEEISESIIKEYYEWLRRNEIAKADKLERHEIQNKEPVLSFFAEIPTSRARTNYDYLKITRESQDELENTINNMKGDPKQTAQRIIKPHYFGHIENNPDILEGAYNYLIETKRSIDSDTNPNEFWDELIENIEKIYQFTHDEPLKLDFFPKSSYISLRPPEALRNYIGSKGGIGTFELLWRSLQPTEFLHNRDSKIGLSTEREVMFESHKQV